MTDPSVWQLVRRAAARRLKRWADEILLESDASPAPPAATATATMMGPPPPVADVRVARGGPPANWLADIEKRAPHLIVNGQFLAAEQGGPSARRWPGPPEATTAGAAPSPSVPRAAPAPRAASGTARTPTGGARRPGPPGGASPPAVSQTEGARKPAKEPPSRIAPAVETRIPVPTPGPHTHPRPLDVSDTERREEDEGRSAMAPARRSEHAAASAPEPPRASPYRSKKNPPAGGRIHESEGRGARSAAPGPARAPVWERPLRLKASAPAPAPDPRPAAPPPSERGVRDVVTVPPAPRQRSDATPAPSPRSEQVPAPEPARTVPDWFAVWVAARQQSAPAAADRRPDSHRPGRPTRSASSTTGPEAPPTRHFPSTPPPRDQASSRRLTPTADPVWAADPWPTLPPMPALEAPDADDLALDLAAQERRRRLRREQAGQLT